MDLHFTIFVALRFVGMLLMLLLGTIFHWTASITAISALGAFLLTPYLAIAVIGIWFFIGLSTGRIL
jgi:hypothetical protein